MIDGLFKRYIDPLWERAATPLVRAGATPNQVTLAGLLLVTAASAAFLWHESRLARASRCPSPSMRSMALLREAGTCSR